MTNKPERADGLERSDAAGRPDVLCEMVWGLQRLDVRRRPVGDRMTGGSGGMQIDVNGTRLWFDVDGPVS